MIKHAILIGVNGIPGLKHLSSPSSYAIKMKHWAQGQGYITHLFVDEPGDESISGRCRRSEILDVAMEIVDQGCDQLLIYFAGHGVERTAGDDVWLLPGYVNDTGDCISILASQQLAYRSGIQHVIFISDACRSPSNHRSIRPISPNPLLPNRNNNSYRTVVDIFYSTWPGEMSVDIRNSETGNYQSTYSDSLLECLHGSVPEVVKEIVNITPGFPAVLSHELNNYLKDEVPNRLRRAGERLQYPMGTVSSSDPLFLSRFGTENFNDTETGLSTIVEHNHQDIDPKKIDEKLDSYLNLKGGNTKLEFKKVIAEFKRNYEFFTSPLILNREFTGLYITGLSNPVVYSGRERDWHSERKDFSLPQNLEYNEEDYGERREYFVGNSRADRFYPIKIIPGNLTQVVFERGQLLSVNYFPTNGYRREEAHHWAAEVADRKAHIIMAAKRGMFQGTHEIGDYLRKYKHLDPTLGLFAAYAYFQKGNFSGVESLYRIMSDDRQSILNDFNLLMSLSLKLPNFLRQDYISMPLLTQGWSYLNLLKYNPYRFLSKQLQPGLWTSFNREGMHIIEENNFLRRI